MNRRNRPRTPARRQAFRDPLPTILIVCEGEVTEPSYLKGFGLHFQNPRVEIIIAKEHGVPKTLVENAKKYKRIAEKQAHQERDDNLKFDSVWCVFDVDDHPMVAEAKAMADANGIQLAISNPSFELWLLLHFTTSGMQHREKISERLTHFIHGYEKHVDFSDFRDGYADAVKRAISLCASARDANESHRNPSTNVYELTELIRNR